MEFLSYFNASHLEREEWFCSPDLSPFFERNTVSGFLKKNHEYVATWYDYKLVTEKTNTLVAVKFIELTKPTYIGKNGDEYQSCVVVKVPINYLHKIPFGSIWLNGISNQRFKLQTYTVTINEDRNNLSIKSIAWARFNNETPSFEFQKYIHSSDINKFEWDKNQLLTIENDGVKYAIHPLQFFITHYGYSIEINRILSVYNWQKVEEKLKLNDNPNVDCELPVVLPRNLSHKDATFLYHLRYDNYTKNKIKKLNFQILNSKGNDGTYKIPCWHTQAITLSFYGISLGRSVLCMQITGMTVPQGEDINLCLAPKAVTKKVKLSESDGSDIVKYRTIKQEREHEMEQVDTALNPINNLVTTSVIEQLKLIGQERKINKIQDINTHENLLNTKLISYEEPTNFGVGEKYGALGGTGMANCFYDVIYSDVGDDEKTRLDIVWEHAIRLRTELGAKVCWYTPKCGFKENDDFRLISLSKICSQLDTNYPPNALIIRVDIQEQAFCIFSFPESKKGSGFSSVVYKVDDISIFFNDDICDGSCDTLLKILVEIVSLNSIGSDYVNSKNGNMAKFIHRPGVNNNWVINGIGNLSTTT
ncbi:hypothetical protein [Pseudoalteromonas sp. JB197]|uniref:hypothetical protein n=1 Tax=Pseudoalteromonas sp. JB197 TaxID=1434839 RepID=UPI001C3DC08B|nr:hypothetical protein [Pseudoalteromonas sp. JB197]